MSSVTIRSFLWGFPSAAFEAGAVFVGADFAVVDEVVVLTAFLVAVALALVVVVFAAGRALVLLVVAVLVLGAPISARRAAPS